MICQSLSATGDYGLVEKGAGVEAKLGGEKMADVVLVEKKDYFCTVSINRPERRNALNPEVARALRNFFNGIKPGGV